MIRTLEVGATMELEAIGANTTTSNLNHTEADSDVESALPLQPPQQPRMDPDQIDRKSSSGSEPSPASEKMEAVKGVEVHDGIYCDSCGMKPIIGPRYKCDECSDYNYCLGCKAAGCKGGQEHSLSRKEGRVSCDLCGRKVHAEIECATYTSATGWVRLVAKVRVK